jgi:hypothetical protein
MLTFGAKVKRRWTKQQVETAEKMQKAGVPLWVIAVVLGRSEPSVRCKLTRHQVGETEPKYGRIAEQLKWPKEEVGKIRRASGQTSI